LPIIFQGKKLDLPVPALFREGRIAGVWRAILQVRSKRNVREHRASHASRIQYQAPARTADDRLAMAVPTQHHLRRQLVSQSLFQNLPTRRRETTVVERFLQQA